MSVIARNGVVRAVVPPIGGHKTFRPPLLPQNVIGESRHPKGTAVVDNLPDLLVVSILLHACDFEGTRVAAEPKKASIERGRSLADTGNGSTLFLGDVR